MGSLPPLLSLYCLPQNLHLSSTLLLITPESWGFSHRNFHYSASSVYSAFPAWLRKINCWNGICKHACSADRFTNFCVYMHSCKHTFVLHVCVHPHVLWVWFMCSWVSWEAEECLVYNCILPITVNPFLKMYCTFTRTLLHLHHHCNTLSFMPF